MFANVRVDMNERYNNNVESAAAAQGVENLCVCVCVHDWTCADSLWACTHSSMKMKILFNPSTIVDHTHSQVALFRSSMKRTCVCTLLGKRRRTIVGESEKVYNTIQANDPNVRKASHNAIFWCENKIYVHPNLHLMHVCLFSSKRMCTHMWDMCEGCWWWWCAISTVLFLLLLLLFSYYYFYYSLTWVLCERVKLDDGSIVCHEQLTYLYGTYIYL